MQEDLIFTGQTNETTPGVFFFASLWVVVAASGVEAYDAAKATLELLPVQLVDEVLGFCLMVVLVRLERRFLLF